jgi:hypothetical protein
MSDLCMDSWQYNTHNRVLELWGLACGLFRASSNCVNIIWQISPASVTTHRTKFTRIEVY